MRTHATARLLLLLLLLLLAAPVATRGAEPLPSFAHCDADTAARLEFIETRLEARRQYADIWWKGWLGGYAVGTVVESVLAGREDDTGRRADYVVSAVKALGGTVRVYLDPPPARTGADAMREVAPVDAAACRERLAIGERQLRANADDTASRWSWKRHAANVGINVAGGIIVAEGFDESRGWASMGVGIAVGEAMILSRPWHGDDDLAEYDRRFNAAAPSRVSIGVAPWGQGARLVVRF